MSGGWLGGRPARYAPGQIAAALEASAGNVSRAALALGTGRTSVHRYLERYPSLRRTLDQLRTQEADRVARLAQADGPPSAPPAPGSPGEGAGSSVDTPVPVPVVPQGRWVEAPPWASGWVRVEVLAPTASFKHYPELAPGDVVALPQSVARSWLAAGVARPVRESGEAG